MKVKLFAFRMAVTGKGLFGGNPQIGNVAEVEGSLNEWLSAHPGIRVTRVEQTATGASGLGNQFLYVTIWYEEGA